EVSQALDMPVYAGFGYYGLGTIWLCRGSLERATDAFRKSQQLFEGVRWQEILAAIALGRTHLANGERQQALEQFRQAVLLVNPGAGLPPRLLSALEEAYPDPEEFRHFCRRFRDEHPGAGDPAFVQWFLEPTEPSVFPRQLVQEAFSGEMGPAWV